jgi:hypothetical protein
MAEGLIGGVIGDEDEGSEAEPDARLGEAQRGAGCGCEESAYLSGFPAL